MKMKKLFLLTITFAFSMLIMISNSQAQKKYVNKALVWAEKGENLDTALGSIKVAETNAKTKDWFKTYYVKGLIFEAIAKSENPEFKKLSEFPLIDAFDNLKKSYEMEGSKVLHASMDLKFFSLVNDIINTGVVAYNEEDFKNALKYFEKSLEVRTLSLFKGEIDTAIIFNCGIVAEKIEDWDNAIKYYEKTIEYNYGEGDTYSLLAGIYKSKEETESYVSTLKDGFEKYPGNQILLAGIINYYLLETDNTDEAFKYLDLARESDPNNPQFYNAEAQLYDKIGDKENAKLKYKKAIELDEKLFDAYYNLGVLYFNEGVELTDKANQITDNAKYAVARQEADDKFKESLPFIEKAHELKPEESSIMSTLKTIYYRLKANDKEMNDKYEEISKKME